MSDKREFENFSDREGENIPKTGQGNENIPKDTDNAENAAGSTQTPAPDNSGDEAWTDNLEEAIHRQTLREQQEYENGAEGLDSLEEASGATNAADPLQGEPLDPLRSDAGVTPGNGLRGGADGYGMNREDGLRRGPDGYGMDPEDGTCGDADGYGRRPGPEDGSFSGNAGFQGSVGNGEGDSGAAPARRRSRNFADPDAVLFDEVVDDQDSDGKRDGRSGHGSRKKSGSGPKKDPSRPEKDKKSGRKERNVRKEEKERKTTGKRRYEDEYEDGYDRRGRRSRRNEDVELFDEVDGEEDERPRRGAYAEDRRDPDDYGDEPDFRRSRREREVGMSRKERREYEEFLAYKEEQRNGRRRKKKHRVRNFIIAVLVLVLLVLPMLAIAARMIGITQGVSTQDIKQLLSDEVKKSQETGAMAGYTNIALFGLDSTQQSLDAGNNRTDVMIIASINNKTGEVKLVSLYRDTYLDIGDGNYQKANAAYAFGGPEQAIKMINTNLDLNITDYVTVGFGGVADLVDEVGGVEIDVQSDEIEHLNNYQSTMATEIGKEYVPVTAPGVQTLNGLQATAYCRIRYTDGGDFKRTERQKEVLSKAFEKLKKSGPVTMIKAANSLSSEIRTSLNPAEIASLALKAMRFNISETSGFPNDQYRTVGYIGDQSCVIPVHLTDNVVWLHQYLFGDSSYQVSSTVQSISDQVSAKSGY